jgi:hypothetical protein
MGFMSSSYIPRITSLLARDAGKVVSMSGGQTAVGEFAPQDTKLKSDRTCTGGPKREPS